MYLWEKRERKFLSSFQFIMDKCFSKYFYLKMNVVVTSNHFKSFQMLALNVYIILLQTSNQLYCLALGAWYLRGNFKCSSNRRHKILFSENGLKYYKHLNLFLWKQKQSIFFSFWHAKPEVNSWEVILFGWHE